MKSKSEAAPEINKRICPFDANAIADLICALAHV
jgi:hypothetical protein